MLVVALVASIQVWTEGDDGLTLRFAEALRVHIAPWSLAGIRATVAQLEPLRSGRFRAVVSYTRDGRSIGSTRCEIRETIFARCIDRIAARLRGLAANVR